MNRINKITSLEWICILFSGSLFTALSYSNYTSGDINVLMFALSQAAFVFLLLIISIPLKGYYKNFKQGIILESKPGNNFANAVYSFIYSIYFIYASAAVIVIGVLFVKSYVDNYLIIPLFVLVIALCGYMSSARGINAVAGSTVLLSFLSVFAVIFIFVSLISRGDLLNFTYAYSNDFSGIVNELGFSVSGAVLLPCMLVFRKNTETKALKSIKIWLVLSFVVCSSIAVMTYAVSGEYSNFTQFPFYTSAQLLEAGAFKRMDVLFLMLWIIGIYVNIAVLFSSLREVFYMTFEAVSAKRFFIISVVLVSGASMTAMKFDKIKAVLLDHNYISVFIILTVLILPALIGISFKLPKIKKLKKAGILLLIPVLCMLTMTGCGKTEIQDRLIIKGLGIDENKGIYTVTVQYIDTSSNSDTQENKCFTVSGESIADAMGKIKNSIGFEPFLGQLSAVAAGYDTAKNMDTIADYFMRRNDVRPSVKLYLCDTTAEELLCFEKDGQIMPIDMLTSISPELSVKSNDYTLLSYINACLDPLQTPVATVLECDDTIRLSTMAVLGSENVYKLNKDDFIAYKLLHGKIEGSIICKDDISCRVEQCKNKIYSAYKDNSVSFYAESDLIIDILENPNNMSNEEVCKKFENCLNQSVMTSADKLMREKHDDIYEFGRRIINFDRKDANADICYREMLSCCKLNINIKCKTV